MYEVVSNAIYDDSAMFLKMYVAKTPRATFRFCYHFYGRNYKLMTVLPKKLEPALFDKQPELSVLTDVIKAAKCWPANKRPLNLFLCNKLYMSETINRVSCSTTGQGLPVFKDFIRVAVETKDGFDVEYFQIHFSSTV